MTMLQIAVGTLTGAVICLVFVGWYLSRRLDETYTELGNANRYIRQLEKRVRALEEDYNRRQADS